SSASLSMVAAFCSRFISSLALVETHNARAQAGVESGDENRFAAPPVPVFSADHRSAGGAGGLGR
ncbi:MAG TPA: hypothetical protein VIJ33_02570, partial [Solirubrobacteraceae bacterium]